MSELQFVQNYTENSTELNNELNFRGAKTFQTPFLGLLLAASILAKTTQAKPFFLNYGQSPWFPSKSLYYPSVSPLWHPIPNYARIGHLSTTPPQIQPPPLHQNRISYANDNPDLDDKSAVTEEVPKIESELENDLQADSTNLNFKDEFNDTSVENITEVATTGFFQTEADFFTSTVKRDRRTTPRHNNIRRAGTRRPSNDYDDIRNRRKPSRRRTTTPSYDYNSFEKQANRRRKRPPSKTRNRPNRRPANKEPEFYDNSQYDDDYYDDYYPSSVNLFARQEDTTISTSLGTTTTTAPTTTSNTNPPSPSPNNTHGYTYGPPQTGYGPPGQTGYGALAQSGYGGSNGNEYVSITYPPLTDPGRDVLAPLLDSLYGQYSKGSIIRRLQELLQPNNFYNSQQYDVNYPDNL